MQTQEQVGVRVICDSSSILIRDELTLAFLRHHHLDVAAFKLPS
jgi:hypothetical protein